MLLLVGLPVLCQAARRRNFSRLLREEQTGELGALTKPWGKAKVTAQVCFGWERCTGPDYSEDTTPVYDGDYLVSGRPAWWSEWQEDNGGSCKDVDPSGKDLPAASSHLAGAQSKPSK